jgi:hypothetical protein
VAASSVLYPELGFGPTTRAFNPTRRIQTCSNPLTTLKKIGPQRGPLSEGLENFTSDELYTKMPECMKSFAVDRHKCWMPNQCRFQKVQTRTLARAEQGVAHFIALLGEADKGLI